jgi:hypothetical protein
MLKVSSHYPHEIAIDLTGNASVIDGSSSLRSRSFASRENASFDLADLNDLAALARDFRLVIHLRNSALGNRNDR